LWFRDALTLRWTQLDALGVADLPADLLTRHVAGVANHMHLRSEARVLSASFEADSASVGAIAQVKLGDPGEQAATADMMRTSTIDIVGKALGYIRTVVATREGRAPLDRARLRQAYRMFEDIYLLEYLWGRVAWCDWKMSADGARLRFAPATPDTAADSFAVAEFRRHQMLAEFQHVFGMEWTAKGSVLETSWNVRARKQDARITFEFTPAAPGQRGIPGAYLLRQVLMATELAPHLEEPLHRLGQPSVSLNDLLLAWELLSLSAEAVRDLLFRKSPDAGALAFAPRLRLSDLEALLAPLGWPMPKRNAIMKFLVYGSDATDGAWSKPFLPVGDNWVVPLLTPLICPNLIRTAELWAAEGAGDAFFTYRGNASETRLRREIAEAATERSWGKTVAVVQTPWNPNRCRSPLT
jgi:hypothetical protein